VAYTSNPADLKDMVVKLKWFDAAEVEQLDG
jgi:hypothetical protein